MSKFDRKKHWETIYHKRETKDHSWIQPRPGTSLDFFSLFRVPVTASIIDIGGGDSFLVDHLLDQGYRDITILDISEAAINKAKYRLGERAENVKWIVACEKVFKFEN
jgi:2-polyprenyl-3-methyl-5-hydroxy-6-metoxy-1,4-benzoquinol methylase